MHLLGLGGVAIVQAVNRVKLDSLDVDQFRLWVLCSLNLGPEGVIRAAVKPILFCLRCHPLLRLASCPLIA